ncbi:MAG: hypothetical protein HC783_13470 [Rhodobacteraceae bacterium]|nr:hypothetical protein [Paracoccaceae bacterium]
MRLIALAMSLAAALPVTAQTLLSEATGNWAGPSNEGFYFRAQLSPTKDKARLRIWGGALDGVPKASGDPEFDNDQIALGAFATRQELEVYDSGQGSILQVVTEFADEDAEGRSVVQIQYLDNQYTVVGYYHLSKFYNPGGEPFAYECDVDLWNMVSIENGQQRTLEPVGFEALNASDWTWDAAFERGFCTRM